MLPLGLSLPREYSDMLNSTEDFEMLNVYSPECHSVVCDTDVQRETEYLYG